MVAQLAIRFKRKRKKKFDVRLGKLSRRKVIGKFLEKDLGLYAFL